eukprot:328866-Amphidinium_carterae.2
MPPRDVKDNVGLIQAIAELECRLCYHGDDVVSRGVSLDCITLYLECSQRMTSMQIANVA